MSPSSRTRWSYHAPLDLRLAVGETGLEPATLRSQSVRSSHLNYSPILLLVRLGRRHGAALNLQSAARGNRTHTLLLVRDFKSRASTYSAIAAALFDLQIIFRTLSFCNDSSSVFTSDIPSQSSVKSSWCEICKAITTFLRVSRVILEQFVDVVNIAGANGDKDSVVTLFDVVG